MHPRFRTHALAAAVVSTVPLTVAAQSLTLPPRYDHVVVVVMENVNYGDIIGSAAAPYQNMLASEGAALSSAYAFKHTSAPNYGELFAGDENGITDNAIPPGAPFTTPNLGAELRQRGFAFAGYAQSLPSVGYTGLASGAYVRGHNPWVNWQNDAPDASPNQLPSTANLPFTLFPTSAAGFATLPTVSFVTPDNDHNMHNGSTVADRVSRGDNFLKNSLGAYYQWAKANNSLLIVTADEDDRNTGGDYNRVPLILAGANLKPGSAPAQTYTLHNILRTVEDMYGLSHAAASNYVKPIAGPFAGDPQVTLASFQNGANAYTGTQDTQLRSDQPSTSFATSAQLTVSLDNNGAAGNQPVHTLIRFDNLIGGSAGQIPADATVLSAKLQLWTGTAGASADAIHVHRMLTSWTESSTWNSVGGGIATDDVQAAATTDFQFPAVVNSHPFFADVSDSVQQWIDGAPNYGWAILPTGPDAMAFNSSEATTVSQRPLLQVAYALYPRFTGADGGSWADTANWAHGTPDAPAAVARFLTRPSPASINLDGDRTVGALVFDSPNPYTIQPGTGGTLTLANYGNTATILVKQGRHAIAAPVTFADPTRIDIAPGAQLESSAGLNVAKSIEKTGPGVLSMSGGLTINTGAAATVTAGQLQVDSISGSGSLTIGIGATVQLMGGPSLASRITTLALAGTLDVGTSSLTIDYTGPSPLPTILDQIRAARATGWTGNGITSSALVAGDGSTTVAAGETPGDTSILIRYTKVGDANLDGTVDFNDLVCLAQNYNTTPGDGAWPHGDFNDDGSVDFADLAAMAQNYNVNLPADFTVALAAVPEPASLASIAALLCLARRRNRRISHFT